MSKRSEAVKIWRRACKERIIVAMGGACCICGYNKCQAALVLHHLDPNKKDYTISSIRANPKSWILIIEELRKCVLLCSNCHAEIHDKITILPTNYPAFSESFLDYKDIEAAYSNQTTCKVCDKKIPSHQKTCSRKCAAVLRYKIDWDSVDFEKELKVKSIIGLAEELGVSDGAIHKRLKKLGLKSKF